MRNNSNHEVQDINHNHGVRAFSRWVWLFPLTLVIHIAEEYWGGMSLASPTSAQMKGVNLSPTNFLLLTGLATALMVLGIILARRFRFTEWLLVCLGTIIVVNGLSHTISTIARAEYNPGVVSGVLLWIPLGAATLVRLKARMSRNRYWSAMLVGLAIHAIVSFIAHGR